MVVVLVSVTTFYASGSFGSGEMISNSTAELSGEMISNSTAELSGETTNRTAELSGETTNRTAELSGEIIDNSTGSIIPSTGMINSEQNEKKS